MQLIPYVLVAISALTHAIWNFIVKKADNGSQSFLGISKLAEGVLFAPICLIWLLIAPAPVGRYWYLMIVGAIGTTLYYVAIGRAYASGNLSLAYPVARASGLIYLPFLALVATHERIDVIGWLAICAIIIGIFVMQLEGFSPRDLRGVLAGFRHPSMIYALLAGFMVAFYSLWDKYALQFLPAFVYYYFYTTLSGLGYVAVLRSRHSLEDLLGTPRQHKWSSIAVAVLNTFTYLLVLTALAASKASYVVALRQLSIGIGAVMGWVWLREPSPLPRRIGVAILMVGCLAVSLAR